MIESTRNNVKLTSPLTAIFTAAVSVVVSLAVFFSEHVFMLAKPAADWDWVAILITAAACLALFRFKVGTIKLIFACAFASLVVSYLT